MGLGALGMTGLGGYTMLPNMAAANFQPIFADASGQLANFNMGLHQNFFATQAGIPHTTLATPVQTFQTAPPAQQPSK